MNNENRITTLMALGEQVMTALDEGKADHGYYSVEQFGISVDIMTKGRRWKLFVFLLPDRLDTLQMPFGLFASRDLRKTEPISKFEAIPDWATYLVACKL
jgi:hypothetical protein